MKTILLISPYWKEKHRWMVSSYKLAELWQRLGYRVVVACMGEDEAGHGTKDRGRMTNDQFPRTNDEGRMTNDQLSMTNDQHKGAMSVQEVSDTLMIYRKRDIFLKDPWNYGIAFGFTGMVRRIIHEEQPDLIIVNKILFWTSLSTIFLRLRGLHPILLTDALVGMTWWPRGRLPRIAAALYAWTLGWLVLCCAQRVIFFHPQPDKLLKRLRIAHKSQVIPTGIDPVPYGAAAHEQRSRPKTQDPRLTITYLGRLESVKGVDDFLAAVDPLLNEYPRLSAQVVGWYRDDHPLVKKYERRVRFTGLRHDVPEILATTDIFVLPSYSEGLSNALMEAMASGCACVASDVGGNAYLLHNGISGFLFPAGDREALKGHIRRLIDDPAKRTALGQAARKRIEDVFSWEKVGKEYQQLFDAVNHG